MIDKLAELSRVVGVRSVAHSYAIKSLEEHIACGSSSSYTFIQNNTNETREHVKRLRIAVHVLLSLHTHDIGI